MNEWMLFILKSTLVSGILCAWYMLALKNRRLHNYNRFFLLFTLYASIQVPLLGFKWSPVYEKPPELFTSAKTLLHTISDPDLIQPAPQAIPASDLNWQVITIGIAAFVSLCLLLTMLARIVWIVRVAKRYPHTVTNGIRMVQTNLPKAPFSFLNTIFWRDTISPETKNGSLILRHELVHIRQKHTYDKLVSQLLTCVFWMNPFYWIIQKELGMLHEFIADEQAIVNNDSDIQEEEYAETFANMLLHVHNRNSYLKPEHQFFSSPIKRRLTMLQKNKTVRASALRRLAIVPLIAGSIFIFAFSPQVATKRTAIKSDKKIVLVVDAGHGGGDAGCRSGSLVEKELSLKVAKRISELAPAYNIEVYLTRSSDQQLELKERVAFSNRLQPDYFLSIHINDSPGKETGKGTFDIAINDKHAKADESKQLAYAILKHASLPGWQQQNTLCEKNPYVLRETTSAAALLEIGDIKNKEQMQYMEDNAKLDELCSHILEGVVEAYKE